MKRKKEKNRIQRGLKQKGKILVQKKDINNLKKYKAQENSSFLNSSDLSRTERTAV